MSCSGGARHQPLPANILLPARLGHTSARRRALLRDAAPGDRWRASRGTLLLIRRQTGLSRGVKDILVTGITVTSLLTSAATASAQNFFEALFGRPGFAPGPVPDANFTARPTGTGDPSLPAGVDCARLSAAGDSIPPQGSAGHDPGRYRRTLRLLRAPRR